MKALVYRGPGNKALEERPKPQLQMLDGVIVKITKTTDLRHRFARPEDVTVVPGRVLGHEGTGIVEAVGAAVTAYRSGDRALAVTSVALRLGQPSGIGGV